MSAIEANRHDALDPTPGLIGGLGRRLRKNTTATVAVAGLVVLTVWVATITGMVREQQGREAMDRKRAQELVGVLEAHVTNVIGYADTYLRAARREYQQSRRLEDLVEFLAAAPPNLAILSHVTVIDRSGVPVFISSGDPLRPGVSATDRDYFRYLRDTDGDEMYISRPARGRNSGLVTIRVARRINGPDGRFDGLIFASIRAEKLTEPFQSQDLGSRRAIGLVGLDRIVRTWSEGGHLLTDIDTGGWPLWGALDEAKSGVVRLDQGTIRDFAYGRIHDYPLVGLISAAGNANRSAVTAFVSTAVAIALLVTLVVVVLTILILRDARMMRVLENEVAVRRRAEAEAVRATEIKSAFLATMSHEIRTPINAITGLFELIEKADVPERQKRQARAGQTAAADLFKLLTNVLDASRLEAKSLDLNMRREPVAPMIAELSQLAEAAIENSGKPIEFASSLDPDVPETLRMDRRRVEQIVLNLIDNAVKFTRAGRIELAVSVSQGGPGRQLCIVVRDTGPGFPEQDQQRIFAPFAQLDSAMTRRAGGTGLGLSICRELAELMRASLNVTSTVGPGSSFSLMLPIE